MTIDYWHLLFQIPALFTGATFLAFLSPWKVTPRLQMVIYIVSALIVLALPVYPALALALVGPVAFLHKLFGVSLTSVDDPVKLPVEKTVKVAKSVAGYVRKPKAAPVTQFLTRAYPNPADGEETEPEVAPEEAPVPKEQPAFVSNVRKFVPDLV